VLDWEPLAQPDAYLIFPWLHGNMARSAVMKGLSAPTGELKVIADFGDSWQRVA
jgi:hypothetical protein